ncbi:hypothetical protein BK809_0006400 [Diplodia seriata]|uniref:Uncharacterized protein n=1 Tax=Diplodia seriata TaxID=420778 RepID=A0A1S8B3G1_9PEZI|nr:hypothetical protein BK809_0006400 [Diplodia seriata]
MTAALFSTPMVESNPSSFWVYWAITIPLTALVIGIWAAWMFWSNRRNKVRDEEAADAVGSDESKQKGAKSEKND